MAGTLVNCCFFCEKLVEQLEKISEDTDDGSTQTQLDELIDVWRNTDHGGKFCR